jgi:3-dehydroquinate synthase
MSIVKVNLKDNPYQIVIGYDTLGSLGEMLVPLKIGQDAVVITNPVIRKHHGKTLVDGLQKVGMSVKFFEVPDGELSKSAQEAFRLIEAIAAYDVGKAIFIVAFGGGVVGDLAGYVAAAYKRGIPYLQVPTTLLAQIDSAIGGKVGIDLPMGKNLVGAFYQPMVVWSDLAVLRTLDSRQIRNGLAEAVKYGIICDKALFVYLENHLDKLIAMEPQVFIKVVDQCSKIKANIVVRDEKETRGIRTILNFGHTVGHAIEAANKFKDYHHGEAVGLGMRVAARISQQSGLLDSAQEIRINELITRAGLPQKIKHITLPAIMRHMEHDKKFKAGKNKFVLTMGIGSVKVVEGISLEMIKSAIMAYM